MLNVMVTNGKEQKEKIGWGGGKKAWVDKGNNTTASHLKQRIKREAGKKKEVLFKIYASNYHNNGKDPHILKGKSSSQLFILQPQAILPTTAPDVMATKHWRLSRD